MKPVKLRFSVMLEDLIEHMHKILEAILENDFKARYRVLNNVIERNTKELHIVDDREALPRKKKVAETPGTKPSLLTICKKLCHGDVLKTRILGRFIKKTPS